jgi:hypothetical protein
MIKGMVSSPYWYGWDNPLYSSSQTFQMKEDISLWFDISVQKLNSYFLKLVKVSVN